MSEPSDYERMAKIIASTPSPKAEQPSSKESFSWPTSKGDPIGPVWSYAGKKGMYQAEALRAFAHDLVDRIKEFELPVREAMKAAGGDGLDAFAYCRMLQRRLEGKEREIERLQRENANLLKRNIILSASPEPTAPASNTSLARINRLWLECCEKIGAGHGFEQYTALKNAARDEIERLQLQNAKLLSALNAKQAKIDALMLEFCPGEMSAEQRVEHGRAQRVVGKSTTSRSRFSAEIENCADCLISDMTPAAVASELRLIAERLRNAQELPSAWQPIETAPIDHNEPILFTDGKWFAAGYVGADSFRKYRISHFAVCQECDWEPTHWMPIPSFTPTKSGDAP